MGQRTKPTAIPRNHTSAWNTVDSAFAYKVEGTAVIVVDNANEPISKWSYRSKKIPYILNKQFIFGHHFVKSEKNISTRLDELYLFGNYGNPKSIRVISNAGKDSRFIVNLDFSDIKLWSDKNGWTKPSLKYSWVPISTCSFRTIDRLPQAWHVVHFCHRWYIFEHQDSHSITGHGHYRRCLKWTSNLRLILRMPQKSIQN